MNLQSIRLSHRGGRLIPWLCRSVPTDLLNMSTVSPTSADTASPAAWALQLVWASTSGHTEYVAAQLVEILTAGASGRRLASVRAETTQASDLLTGDVLVLASSTWNTGGIEGQLNPHMAELLDKRARNLSLGGRPCACVGLGDHRYYYRAQAAEKLERFVQDHGGRLLTPTLRIIDEPYGQEDTVRAWARSLEGAVGR